MPTGHPSFVRVDNLTCEAKKNRICMCWLMHIPDVNESTSALKRPEFLSRHYSIVIAVARPAERIASPSHSTQRMLFPCSTWVHIH